MVTILFFISFSIHIVLLIVTWKLVNQIKTLKSNQPEEIMDIFEAYLEEVKEENRELQKQLGTNKKNRQVDFDEENEIVHISPVDHTSNMEDYEVPGTAHLDGQGGTQSQGSDVTLSFEANVLHLYTQGLSIEEIAKKLNRGKTEVMLIVKFHSKNER